MSGWITKNLVADEDKVDEGVWITLGIDTDVEPNIDIRIKCRRVGNKDFKKDYAKRGKKYSMMRGNKQALEDKALMESICETCVVQFDNIENINAQVEGEPPKTEFMAYSYENALALFTYSPDAYNIVISQIGDIDLYQSKSNEELGNV